MKRNNRLFTILIIILIAFTAYNFIGDILGRKPPRHVSNEKLTVMYTEVTENFQSPAELTAGLFDSKDIVFIGEMSLVRQHAELISQIMPVLYDHGINILAMEFALYEDQDLIDEILSGDIYDEESVKEVLFNRLCLWGYEEYAGIFKTAWLINRNRPSGREPMRIIGLNVRSDWELIRTEEDLNDNELMSRVMARGIPDVHMADVIMKEIVQKDKKALVYTAMSHSFTDYKSKDYEKAAHNRGLADSRRTGNIINDLVPGKSATLLLHAPWKRESAEYGFDYPVRGAFDRLLEKLPEDNQVFAVSTETGIFASLEIANEQFTRGYDDLALSDLCDAYIVPGPISGFVPVNPIPGFINEGNRVEAIRNFPGPDPGEELTAEEFNDFIKGTAGGLKMIFEKL